VRVLGIDPGSRRTGWGVVEERARALVHVASGTIALAPALSLGARLAALHAECGALLARFAPSAVVLERAFVARNVHSALRLGEVRGAVLAAVAAAGVPLAEYAPAAVKLATAGHGAADKEGVGRSVAAYLRLAHRPAPDAADALALALCHLQRAPLARAIASADGRGNPRGVLSL
jgi:crossover junction endodeoxyribonuclease RuvC